MFGSDVETHHNKLNRTLSISFWANFTEPYLIGESGVEESLNTTVLVTILFFLQEQDRKEHKFSIVFLQWLMTCNNPKCQKKLKQINILDQQYFS